MLLKEAVSIPPELKGVTLKISNVDIVDDSDDDYNPYSGSKSTTYAIKDKKGTKIGELRTGIFGGTTGELWGRNLPGLENYKGKSGGGLNSGALGQLHAFFKSKTGLKWLEVSRRKNFKFTPYKR